MDLTMINMKFEIISAPALIRGFTAPFELLSSPEPLETVIKKW